MNQEQARENDRRKQKAKKKRAKLKIASLNMRGYSSAGTNGQDKWMLINQVMRDNRIAVLGLQETHLNEARLLMLNNLFEPSMKIIMSSDPDSETGARGVAIALNKRMINTDTIEPEEIIPGRAIACKIPWGQGETLRILNIYAPNAPAKNEAFWTNLKTKTKENTPDIKIMLGDCNIVEDAIDRLPAHLDDEKAVEALRNFRSEFDLKDGWRLENESRKDFTYLQVATSSHSRIDRIYVARDLINKTLEWEIEEAKINTDHRMVTCAVAKYRSPDLGRGRWAMHHTLLRDETFLKQVQKMGEKARDGSDYPDPKPNIQMRHENFKKELAKLGRTRAKENVPKLDRRIKKLKEARLEILNDDKKKHDKKKAEEAAEIQNRIEALETKRFGQVRTRVAAKDFLEGETIGKYWSKVNVAPKLDEIIYEMKRHGIDTSYTNKSLKMAEMMRHFYKGLQKDGIDNRTEEA